MKLPEISASPLVIAEFVVGAETTSESSTMANWFCAPVSLISRWVTWENFFEPAPLNLRLTTQAPVEKPWLLACRPAVASEMSEPGTSTGPRMYLVRPSVSQVTIGLVGSAALLWIFDGSAQVSAV